MEILKAWNDANWNSRIIFLTALCRKDPAMVERILKRCSVDKEKDVDSPNHSQTTSRIPER